MTALKSRRSAFISLLAASTLAIAACGSVEDDAANGTDGTTTAPAADGTADTATTAAAAEGEITVACTADETLCAAWADAFEAESGISTNYVRMSSGEAVARFQAAGDNPEFDVWHAGPVDGFIAATQEGLLEQYESPNAADLDSDVVDPEGYWAGVYLGALGFCFGGMCVLDLARSGADVRGVVSIHGILKPSGLPANKIDARILMLHGYDDPLAPPEDVLAIAKELTAAGADWQLHAYGNTVHSFTNPAADNKEGGMVYNEVADRRSWHALMQFLEETLR